MKIVCNECGENLINITGPCCYRCGSKEIVKECDSDRAWLNWFYRITKG